MIDTIILCVIGLLLMLMIYNIRISTKAIIRKMELNKREIKDTMEDLMDVTEGFDDDNFQKLSGIRQHYEKVNKKQEQRRQNANGR
jgi:predicted Holliday junction resolvase-like endonuclease